MPYRIYTEIKKHVYLPITPSQICFLCKSYSITSPKTRYQNRLIRLAFNVIDPGSVNTLKMHSILGKNKSTGLLKFQIEMYYHHIEIELNSK